ncbi:RagB/SusD family nutrient uptake outer membrane protein [Chitinophaga lutea]|uniref:RagB/SusD family nutrient uptake outer membrane protein n=1 Tax=Chitinophaga lutea TaxID=2488634 RepID=A0A3N4PXH9_9BACT|nr:RagB/SusD family nutrient uptake outer membrane protein [Chitinophaga lutea]RPE08787.1 RagB/SusD family nutrient uptake outer membrane protein [Chitinophaga lutea]
MKRIKLTAIFFAGLMMIASVQCNKTLDESPVSTSDPKDFWKDQNDAKAWMAGVYNQLQTVLRLNWFDWGEVRSDNMTVAGTGNAQVKMLSNALTANDADLNGTTTWTELYVGISLCNFGIKYFPEMIAENRDAGINVYKDYLGQCYALRAMYYFYGLRVWGKMPLLTVPVEDLNQEVQFARSPIADVKKRILDDIDASLAIIGNDITTKAMKYRIQKGGVYALKTDVHMWFQEYDAALEASQNCITESKCTWVTDNMKWKDMFVNPENSTETIFNLWWNDVERGNQGVGICQKLGSGSNTHQYKLRPDLWQELKNHLEGGKTTDGRFYLCWDTVKYNSVAKYTTDVVQFGKFSLWKAAPGGEFIFEGNNTCNVKIPIYRFADIMLLRAEALAHKSRFTEALDIVNKVRERVGYKVKATEADVPAGMDKIKGIERIILKERQFELLGEGKRWFDLCRIDKMYDFTNTGYEYLREMMNPVLATREGATLFDNNANTPNAMGRILFPINSNAFNANRKLVGDQNPPYDE